MQYKLDEAKSLISAYRDKAVVVRSNMEPIRKNKEIFDAIFELVMPQWIFCKIDASDVYVFSKQTLENINAFLAEYPVSRISKASGIKKSEVSKIFSPITELLFKILKTV